MAKFLPCLALAMGISAPAFAATLDFTATVTDGDLAGQSSTGTLTYDEGLLTSSGDESIGLTAANADYVDPGMTISFEVGPVLFTEQNDVDYPDYPLFRFVNGVLDFVSFVVVDGRSGADLEQFGVSEFYFSNFTFLTDGTGAIDVEVNYLSDVPLPAGMPLLALGLGAFGIAARRRKS